MTELVTDATYNAFVEEAELFFVKKMVVSPRIKRVYSRCLDIVFNISKDPEIDYAKGVICYNPRYGQGKSFFFEVAQHRYRRIQNKNLFKMSSAKELAAVFKEGGEKALLEYIKVRNLFIDDIGDEGIDKEFTHYKEKLNVIRYVFLKRYEMWSANRDFRTFGTTNLTIDQISKCYDGRVADRILEMAYFESIDFLDDDQSFRQLKDVRKLTEAEKRANWIKVTPPPVIEKPDFTKYMNELLGEPDSYIENMGESNWNIVKRYMFENDYLKPEDFALLTEESIDAGVMKAKLQVRQSVKTLMGNCLPIAIKNAIDERQKNITREDGQSIAENVIVKKKFLEYRDQRITFKLKTE